MLDSVIKQIHSNVILTVCDIVPSETGASQSLCWRGSSGWEPAPQMSAVLQHSHSAHSSHGGPCLLQVSHHTDWCTLIWQQTTISLPFYFCHEYVINQKAWSYFFYLLYFTVLCCHWTLRFPKALLLCLSFTWKMWQSFCFLLCSKFSACFMDSSCLNNAYLFNKGIKCLYWTFVLMTIWEEYIV